MLGTTNISVSLVRNTLGEATNSVGSLCKSSRINIWSKYKPVKYAADSTEGNANWYRADNRNCGIVFPVITNLARLDTEYFQWTHDAPTGTASSPFRLGDFRKYNPNAVPFIRTGISTDFKLNLITDTMLHISLIGLTGSREDNLTLDDFKQSSTTLGDYYVTVQFVHSDGSVRLVQSANYEGTPPSGTVGENIKLRDGGTNIYIPASKLSKGRYKVRIYLSNIPANGTQPGSPTYIALPSDINNKTGNIYLDVVEEAGVSFRIDKLSYASNGVYKNIDERNIAMRTKTGDIYAHGYITTARDFTYTLYGSRTRVQAIPSFVDTESAKMQCTLLNANKQRVEYIAVPAGSEVEFYLATGPILATDSNGTVQDIALVRKTIDAGITFTEMSADMHTTNAMIGTFSFMFKTAMAADNGWVTI